MVIKDKALSSIKADIVHAFLSVSLPPSWGQASHIDTGWSQTVLHGPGLGREAAVIVSSPGCGSTRWGGDSSLRQGVKHRLLTGAGTWGLDTEGPLPSLSPGPASGSHALPPSTEARLCSGPGGAPFASVRP